MAFMVTVKPTGVEVGFTVETTADIEKVLTAEKTAFDRIYALNIGASNAIAGQAEAAEQAANAPTAAPAPAKRSRKANQPDPSTASAPAPAPVPAAAPAPDLDAIPPMLQRSAAPPPPPPLVGAAPPAAPAAPRLRDQVIAECRKRAAGAPDGGKGLADWIAAHGLVVPGATFDEAMDVLLQIDDSRLGTAASQLGVTA